MRPRPAILRELRSILPVDPTGYFRLPSRLAEGRVFFLPVELKTGRVPKGPLFSHTSS